MQMEILTKSQAKKMIREEVIEKCNKEFALIWKNIQMLADKIKILNEK